MDENSVHEEGLKKNEKKASSRLEINLEPAQASQSRSLSLSLSVSVTHPKRQGVSIFVEEVSTQSRSSAVKHFEQHDARRLVAQTGHFAFKTER